MAGLRNKILKKLIFSNRFALPKGVPRIQKTRKDLSLVLTGNDSTAEFTDSAAEIFNSFSKYDSVLIKVNLNSPLEYPASVSLEFLETVIKCLTDIGISDILVADCSAVSRLPTKKVMKAKGILGLKKMGIRVRSLDYGPWRDVMINGRVFKRVILHGVIYKYDKIINLSNLKTHSRAGFSAATKNLIGFMHPYQRFELHQSHLEERIADVVLALKPDLNIIDARKVFISGGPDYGEAYKTGTIIINSDIIEADTTAYKLLVKTQKSAGIEGLPESPLENRLMKELTERGKPI